MKHRRVAFMPNAVIREQFLRGVRVAVPHSATTLLGSRKALRVKYGIDPTRPDLTLGHLVVLRKLRLVQEFGHRPVIVIGDFTARFGDPTEKMKTRTLRNREEVSAAAAGYRAQIGRILDLAKTEVRLNGEWYDAMSAEELLRLEGKVTVTQMLEREMFQARQKKHLPIGLHELSYPVLQGYDSVMLRADVTVIGHDQLFNELSGRKMQETFGQKPQAIFGLDILVGTDGKQKMSQSLGNAIALADPPAEQFGKIMSVPDSAIAQYAELLTNLPLSEVKSAVRQGGIRARDMKSTIAEAVVAQVHGKKAAHAAREAFVARFQKKEQMPRGARLPIRRLKALPHREIVGLLVEAGFATSRTEAHRLVRQGGVRVDGAVVEDPQKRYAISQKGITLAVGKHRAFKIVPR